MTSLGTSLGVVSLLMTELQQLEDYLARNLFSWMRADSRVEASGKVTSFVDKVYLPSAGGLASNARSIDQSHSFAQATSGNQVAAVSAQSIAYGQLAAVFSGSQFYVSSLPLANWAFANGGAGYAMWSPWAITQGGRVNTLCSTVAAGGFGGIQHLANSLSMRLAVYTVAPTASIPDGDTGTVTVNQLAVAYARHGSSLSPNFTAGLGTASGRSGTYSVSPAGTPQSTMTIGATTSGGANAAMAVIPEILWANTWNQTLDNQVRRYLNLRYFLGIA